MFLDFVQKARKYTILYSKAQQEQRLLFGTPPDIRFRETTFRGYSGPLQTLNVELGLLPTFGV